MRVAYEPGDNDDDEVIAIPAPSASPPQLLPVPSAWWDTPAVNCRALNPVAEEARTARLFVRELLTYWGLSSLTDDAEMIIGELVVNAVRHGMRAAPPQLAPAPPPAQYLSAPPATDQPATADAPLRLCILRRAREVMLAVTDPSPEPPQPRAPGWTGESGRGLQIVGALSYIWGWSPIEDHGKAVWAVLRY